MLSKNRVFLPVIFSLVVGFFVGYILATHPLSFPQKITPENERTRLVTFQSSRVPFSFTHSANFPVTPLSNHFVYQFDDRVEAINLGTLDNTPNAGGPAEGYIIVERYKNDGLTTEERLLKENVERIKRMKAAFKNYSESAPTIKKTALGNGEAYQVVTSSTKDPGGVFAPVATTYYIERDGLRYIIGVTPQDPERAKQLQDLLQTLHFDY